MKRAVELVPYPLAVESKGLHRSGVRIPLSEYVSQSHILHALRLGGDGRKFGPVLTPYYIGIHQQPQPHSPRSQLSVSPNV